MLKHFKKNLPIYLFVLPFGYLIYKLFFEEKTVQNQMFQVNKIPKQIDNTVNSGWLKYFPKS